MFQRLPKFEYLAPTVVEEACALLAQYKGQAKVLAGGTNLLSQMKWRYIAPTHVIGLAAITGLHGITYNDMDGLSLGALTSIRSLERSTTIKERFPILAQAASLLGSVEIRNRATVGGNLCNASPSANTALALIALDATVRLVSTAGERAVSLKAFFKSPGETVADPSEILTEIQVPALRPESTGAFIKFSTRNSPVDRPIVSVATLIARAPDKGCADARIVLGGVAPTPMRAQTAESLLVGRALDQRTFAEVANSAAQEAQPISDISASADYRREMVRVLTRRALDQALDRLK
jgi:aerobic carbon-monoxide dehydrogenase medium subunit